MKRIYIILAAVAATALVSCQRENDFSDNRPSKNSIVFLPQGVATRSAEFNAPVSRQSIPLDMEIDGQKLYLEETVTEIADVYDAPATRGTPAYTSNVTSLYPSLTGTAVKNGTNTVVAANQVFNYIDGDPGYYEHRYSKSDTPWNQSDDLYFFLQMPSEMSTLSNQTFGKNASNQMYTTFSYTTPTTAKAQQDILFAGRALNYDEYKSTYDEGRTPVPVRFYHALTGVKFALGNDNSGDTKTHVTSVTFHGLKDSGTATIVLPNENGTGDDKSASHVSWVLGTTTSDFSQAYVDGKYTDNTIDNTVSYDGTENPNGFGDSFYTAGANRNLNDAAASMTFWFIPQAMTDDVTVDVTFYVSIVDAHGTVKPGELKTLTLNLGEQLGSTTTWDAGQIRTYTIKPNLVDVEIDDTVEGAIKKDVVINNTGNVPIYVRVNLIGNWVGNREYVEGSFSDETVLMGYTDNTMTDEVARWNDKDNDATWTSPTGKTYTYVPYGTFTGLPPKGTTSAGGTEVNGWIRHDKYYYYKTAIGPGESIGSGTADLFQKYEITRTPDFWINDNNGTPRQAQNVHLVMDVIVQAILAPMDADGKPVGNYEAAWIAALNPDNDPNFNFNDL